MNNEECLNVLKLSETGLSSLFCSEVLWQICKYPFQLCDIGWYCGK